MFQWLIFAFLNFNLLLPDKNFPKILYTFFSIWKQFIKTNTQYKSINRANLFFSCKKCAKFALKSPKVTWANADVRPEWTLNVGEIIDVKGLIVQIKIFRLNR